MHEIVLFSTYLQGGFLLTANTSSMHANVSRKCKIVPFLIQKAIIPFFINNIKFHLTKGTLMVLMDFLVNYVPH